LTPAKINTNKLNTNKLYCTWKIKIIK